MTTRCRLLCAVLLCAASSSARAETPAKAPPPAVAPTAALKALTVFPTEVQLNGPRDIQRLIVLGEYADGRKWDLTRTAKFTPTTAALRVDAAGLVRGTADGEGAVTVAVGGQSVTVPVKVSASTVDAPVSFAREIEPVLTKYGCNSGACHGAQHGRGGFKLSLFGFDPAYDHAEIVQSAKGRRVVVSDPERSILLQKPGLVMEHGGGEKLKLHSREYELVRQWLGDGAPAPLANEAHVTKLAVFPPKRVLTPGEQQQLIVRATWSDGRSEDVTATAQYDSLNDAVAGVTADGLATAKERGETHIMVRFGGQATVMQMSLPFGRDEPGRSLEFPPNNYIDEKLRAKWQDVGLAPSALCSDDDFFRRIHLDAIGTLPDVADVRAFLADKAPDKRAKAIDKVLNRPEFVDFWALKWGDLLRIDRDQLQDKGMWSFANWVRAALRDNTPVDEFVRDIITAEGSTYSDGPANFYRIGRTAPDYSETVTQVFLGIRLQCAKCHHHPFEKWSQEDYYGMASFFSRVGTKNSQEFGIFGRETVIYLLPTGEVNHPRKGGVVKPHPLDGPVMDDPFDRRRKLAEWLTAKENPYFARNIANRFWAYMMGRGLVEPIDDMRATNPPSNPELLDALAKDLTDNKFDLKRLLRSIMNSRAYQLSSAVTPGNAADTANIHHTRFTVKRLTAEQLADGLDFVTGTREKYQGLPLGTRAIQLPDTKVRSFLMDVFGRPARAITCECERTGQPNIAQALHLLNGDFLNKKIEAPTGRIENLFKEKKPIPDVIEELYLVTLGRPPRAEEAAKAQDGIRAAPTPKEGVQDLLWVLLNSREFLFNH